MSMTSNLPRRRNWFSQLLSGQPHQIIGDGPNPYMLRWYVIPKNRYLKVYVHKFLRSDEDRALHDHPWAFVSLIIRGRYNEVTEADVNCRRTGSVAFRPAEWRHRVELIRRSCHSCRGSGIGYGKVPDGRWMETDCGVCDGSGDGPEIPAWTLIVTGPKVRPWGFWCPGERFIPWRQWGAAGCGEFE